MHLLNLLVFIGVAMFTAILGAIIVMLLARASKPTAQQEDSARQARMGQADAGVGRTGSAEGKGRSRPPTLSPEERAKRKEMLQRTHLPGSPTPDVPTIGSQRPSVPPTEMGERR